MIWRARPEQVRDVLERFDFVLIEDHLSRDPLFRDRLGRSATFDDINDKASVDRGLRYALYQVWMDVSRQGF